jgi:hypothetical protein
MSKHTPGPWRLDDVTFLGCDHRVNLISDIYHFIDAGRGYVGDGFGVGGCIGIADARLITAAPDLLDALRELRNWYGLDPSHTPLDQWESLALEFYNETGFLRPGKDMPSAYPWSDEQEAEREQRWREWADARRKVLIEKVNVAIAKAEGSN